MNRRRLAPGIYRAAGWMAPVAVAVFAAVTLGREGGGGAPRLVLATGGAPQQRLMQLGTTSLYAKNDPWRGYLAPESVCPGGERTDLPRERQLATLACLVNYARALRSLPKLSILPRLNTASRRKAIAILRCANFAHNPCGGDWKWAVRSTGYGGDFGENLYLAGGPFAAPRVAVDAWLNSEPHRRNLFSPRWQEQGLALLVIGRFDGFSGASLWVSVLGRARSR